MKTLIVSLLVFHFSLFLFHSGNAQIFFQGLEEDHEGGAAWNADGSGPEPAGYGHEHPFGWGSSLYYAASRDYDGIDPDPDAALAHLVEGMDGFPLFEQALDNNGFSAAQVKIKLGLFTEKNDLEGEDWFTFNSKHYLNKYDGTCMLELDGEPMVQIFYRNVFFTYDSAIYNVWLMETNFNVPWDASSNSSPSVQAVAAAFLQDLSGEQLRMIFTNMNFAYSNFSGNGRSGSFFDLSGYLEKGTPHLPFIGPQYQHQGLAAWDADGTGPEPAAEGHIVHYGGEYYPMWYYMASRDYDSIDGDPEAAMCFMLQGGKGFPNLETQLAYRGYTLAQVKMKAGLSILGNDEEGVDWGLEGSVHWWRFYGTPVTIEVAGEQILHYMIDTNYSCMDLDAPALIFTSRSSFSPAEDVSCGASADAQYVALSFLKDIGDQFMGCYMEGQGTSLFSENGRSGGFQQIDSGYLTLGYRDYGTTVWPGDVSGTWEAENSPFMIEGGLVVPDGETLSIEPGVTVAFRGHYYIRVDGCVLAQGTDEENIVFTHSNPTVWWDGFDYWQTPSTNDTSRFDYCVFEYGKAIGDFPENCGGALMADGFGKILVDSCLFRYNQAVDASIYPSPSGGAIALANSSPVIRNSTFVNNKAYFGGVITCAYNSHPVIDKNIFTGNRAVGVGYGQGYGGAVACYAGSHPVIKNNIFNENVADLGGGALTCISHCYPSIHHNLFYHDTASWGGAIEVQDTCAPQIVNNTIAHNHADLKGGGIDVWTSSKINVRNTILWENTCTDEGGGSQVHLTEANDTVNLYYSDIQYGKPGIGGPGQKLDWVETITEDPQFDTLGYFLTVNSPCVDTGDPDEAYNDNEDPENPGYALWPAMGTLRNDMGVYGGLYQGFPVSVEERDDPGLNNNSLVAFLCYPNPASGIVDCRWSMANGRRVTLKIYDLFGRELRVLVDEHKSPGEYTVRMDVSALPAGVYLVRLQAGHKVYTQKVIRITQS